MTNEEAVLLILESETGMTMPEIEDALGRLTVPDMPKLNYAQVFVALGNLKNDALADKRERKLSRAQLVNRGFRKSVEWLLTNKGVFKKNRVARENGVSLNAGKLVS